MVSLDFTTHLLNADKLLQCAGPLGKAIAYDEGKLIGILLGSGGIVGEIPGLVESIGKDTGAVLIYEPDPAVLVQKLVLTYSENHFRRPFCFCTVT